MFNSAHLADNNFTPGIRFYKIDVFVSAFFRLFFVWFFFLLLLFRVLRQHVRVAWGLSPSWVGHAQFRRPTTRVTVVLVLVK